MAEVEDGLVHVMLDMRNIAGDHIKYCQDLISLNSNHIIFRSKRGLDFGLGRGYSGSQVGKLKLNNNWMEEDTNDFYITSSSSECDISCV